MKRLIKVERRQLERFPQNLEVKLRLLPHLGSEDVADSETIPARIQNISQGGVCLITPTPIEKSALVRAEIPVGDQHPSFATLMRVCWTEKQDQIPPTYISCLEALL